MKTKELEHELDVVAIEQLDVESQSFSELLYSNWVDSSFPPVTEEAVGMYLKRLGAYTKNYRTGICLYQCSHVYDVQCSTKGGEQFVKCKCRPTMRKNPPFYKCFVIFVPHDIRSANCQCPAGETQSCVHVSALLLTLAQVAQASCTSLPCAWSRPKVMGRSTITRDVNFEWALVEGYVEEQSLQQPSLDVGNLLKPCDKAGVVTGVSIFFAQEEDRKRAGQTQPLQQPQRHLLIDTLDRLRSTTEGHDLMKALEVTSEELSLLQTMTLNFETQPSLDGCQTVESDNQQLWASLQLDESSRTLSTITHQAATWGLSTPIIGGIAVGC